VDATRAAWRAAMRPFAARRIRIGNGGELARPRPAFHAAAGEPL